VARVRRRRDVHASGCTKRASVLRGVEHGRATATTTVVQRAAEGGEGGGGGARGQSGAATAAAEAAEAAAAAAEAAEAAAEERRGGMGSRKVEFTYEVEDDKHLAELLDKKGLLYVIDVYTEWCGPCKAILSTLQRAFLDYGEKGVRFLTACADRLTALKEHAGRSRPLFLFYSDRQVVEKVEGCSAPALLRAIEANLPGAAEQ